jgi:hypothetical protein
MGTRFRINRFQDHAGEGYIPSNDLSDRYVCPENIKCFHEAMKWLTGTNESRFLCLDSYNGENTRVYESGIRYRHVYLVTRYFEGQ